MRQARRRQHVLDPFRAQTGNAIHCPEPEPVAGVCHAPGCRTLQTPGAVRNRPTEPELSQTETDAARPQTPLAIREQPPHLARSSRITKPFRLAPRANPDQLGPGGHPQRPVAVELQGPDRRTRQAGPRGCLEPLPVEPKQAVVGPKPDAVAVGGKRLNPAACAPGRQEDAALWDEGVVQLQQLPPGKPYPAGGHERCGHRLAAQTLDGLRTSARDDERAFVRPHQDASSRQFRQLPNSITAADRQSHGP